MTFAEQLRAAKGDLTARQVAEAIENNVSVRTVEDWLAGRHTPHRWKQKITLGKLANLTGNPPVATWDGVETAADVEEYLAQENLGKPKRSRKGANFMMPTAREWEVLRSMVIRFPLGKSSLQTQQKQSRLRPG